MSVPSSSSMLPAKPPAVIPEPEKDQDESREEGEHHTSRSTSLDPNADDNEDSKSEASQSQVEQPPLPVEEPPPLPNEEPPAPTEDDGWEPIWEDSTQAFYFYNRFTQKTQWENPRLPSAANTAPTLTDTGPPGAANPTIVKKTVAGGYDPAIHGDYDPNADYAKIDESAPYEGLTEQGAPLDPTTAYAATGAFNRFTGKWQAADVNPDKFSDEAKSKRQMNAFFDVDAAANAHDGRSLKAERSSKKISKAELKAYREKRKEKKEERRRAWLRD